MMNEDHQHEHEAGGWEPIVRNGHYRPHVPVGRFPPSDGSHEATQGNTLGDLRPSLRPRPAFLVMF